MPSLLSRGIALACFLAASGSFAFAADGKPKPKVLVDFTRQDAEIEAGVPKPIKKYDYSFEAWNNKLVFLDGKGILIPALPGRGGMGTDNRLSIGATNTHCLIEFIIGNRNESESFTLSMVDADGTDVSWYINLKDKPRGVAITMPLDLAKPDMEDKPGKKPGFDKTKTKSWQIKGNWQEPKLEVLLVRISATTS
ncbi:MAG: hypothetical protein IAE82_11470 [Opitutaceae bacterium]|nr:hypothetical protein [Opitutaceae bacterium]